MPYSDDRSYGDRFLPEIKKLITPHLLMPDARIHYDPERMR